MCDSSELRADMAGADPASWWFSGCERESSYCCCSCRTVPPPPRGGSPFVADPLRDIGRPRFWFGEARATPEEANAAAAAALPFCVDELLLRPREGELVVALLPRRSNRGASSGV